MLWSHFGSMVAPWMVGLRDPGFLWVSGCLWLDSQVSTKGLALSELLPQLSTQASLCHMDSPVSKKGWTHTPACLSGGSLFSGQIAACSHRTAGAVSLGLLPLCPIWSKLAKGWSTDGAGRGRGGMDVHANAEHDNIDLISFENKGNTARVQFLHTVHSRHISPILK